MTHQTEFDCPTPETHNWGCGCPSDVAAAIASCPGHEVDGPSPCRCPCEGCKHNCAAHQSAAVSAAVAPPTNRATAEAALAAVETALGDTLVPDAREEALAGITAVLPEVADRAAVLADVERAIRAATGNCGYKAEDGCDFCNGVDAALDQVRRMADETATETPDDTLPAWLYQRFMPDGIGWDHLDEDDREYWAHQARAVRRAVARGGFKQPAAGARQDGTQP